MFPFASAQVFTMHPHHHHHQQQQQQQHRAMQAQQRQANMLFYQFNQLRSMQPSFSNPTLTPARYMQQSIEQQKPQQVYRTDQLVPQSSPLVTTPVQQKQQIPRSSPINITSIDSPNAWMDGSLLKNSEVFRPIIRTLSNTKLDVVSYVTINNSLGSTNSIPSMVMSFESPRQIRHRRSKRQWSLGSHDQRPRLNSGSSCYESDSPEFYSQDDDEFEWRPANSKTLATMSPPSKKRSQSEIRSDLLTNEQVSNDIYRAPANNNGFLPTINQAIESNTNHNSPTKHHNNIFSRPKLIQYIEENIIGKDYVFQGPWGVRRMIYCDYTASGRPLQFIESYIKTHVLPLYGNTHSETSLCAQQSTKYREEARDIIKKSVNANEHDILLFCGNGSTGAIHTLVDTFDLHDENIRKNTVVLISAFEHHSNILPWKEKDVEMVRIPTTQQGTLDVSVLEQYLQYYSSINKRILCSFNAASNITGILTDVNTISTLVHSYSGLIFWDYATAAPYVKIDMNSSPTSYKDAIFISTHKFVGGPSTPGILVAKKVLFSLKPPKTCGGGTVNFVTRTCHEYNYDIETREEGGTPDVIGCIRAGLVFQLKDSIDANYMQAREDELVKRFYRHFKKTKTLILLGSQTAPRLPIFSFLIYVPSVCKYLHHNFVCLLLNDLFGIQVRSGCACAGPYALDLLNVDDAQTDVYCLFMTEDIEARGSDQIVRTMMMKPGFTRLNLAYFTNDDDIEYVLNAVQFIATEGWKFLPLYTYNPSTAGWTHRSGFQLATSSLEDITYKSGKMQYYRNKKDAISSREEKVLSNPFREAKVLAANALRYAIDSIDYTSDPALNIPEKYKHMIWFTLPIDIALMMIERKDNVQKEHCNIDSIPFIPLDAKKRLTDSGKPGDSSNSDRNRKKYHTTRAPSSLHAR
ncbi:unnamed protein product [Rotaria sordida]|uniref:Aminotransferase class V domain-containing protein n=1 Tax=Rotaria sordida TaxID=392033 RepID=A0A813UQG1_9BILA|nr:unnamed protein product [Rotaria sordida]CAF0897067.1 unnamed protein product [Rotaria sordida]CAF3536909.1 unnamed protein product [Rotaria sordida]